MPHLMTAGRSKAFKDILGQIEKISKHDSFVLITGESGTGKELAARAIHQQSLRKDQIFQAVHCGAVPEDLMESEFFGYEKGAFTGADSSKIGLFESADKGTLFLDELGELPVSLQAKLLRVVQDGVVRPVGSLEEKKINVRIISATHRDLEKMIREKQFREDLFHRLNVIRLNLPPLRQRKEDISALAQAFLAGNQFKHRKKLNFSKTALEKLENYHYPGNIRELENMIEKAVLLCDGSIIEDKDLFNRSMNFKKETHWTLPKEEFDLDGRMAQFEKTAIEKTLNQFRGNRLKTANFLKITPRSLKHRIKKYQLSRVQEKNRQAG